MPMSRSASVNSFMKYGNYNETKRASYQEHGAFTSPIKAFKLNLCKMEGPTEVFNYPEVSELGKLHCLRMCVDERKKERSVSKKSTGNE